MCSELVVGELWLGVGRRGRELLGWVGGESVRSEPVSEEMVGRTARVVNGRRRENREGRLGDAREEG